MLSADDIPFASHQSARPSLLRESLTPAELRLVSEVEELLEGRDAEGLEFAARWIVDLQHDVLQLRQLLHAYMETLHHVAARADSRHR